MLFLERRLSEDTQLAIWKIEETEETFLSFFSERRKEYEQEIASYKSESRRLECLAVRMLLLRMTGRENGVVHDSDGRPSLQGGDDSRFVNNLKISISHTKGYAAVILSTQNVVGIDIEVKRDKIFRVKHKFLSEKEQRNLDEERLLESLLLHWCAKETLYKMAQRPLVEFAEEMEVEPFRVSEEGSFVAKETKSLQRYSMHYQLFDDFVMTYCESKKNLQLD